MDVLWRSLPWIGLYFRITFSRNHPYLYPLLVQKKKKKLFKTMVSIGVFHGFPIEKQCQQTHPFRASGTRG